MCCVLHGRGCVATCAWLGICLGGEWFWVVHILGGQWLSCGPSEICTALAAKDKIGVEGSASGYEGGHDSLCRSSAVRWPASVIRP